MSEYKRLTDKNGSSIPLSMWIGGREDWEVYQRLAELEDKIENGTLIELPCKVFNDFYFIGQYANGGELTNKYQVCSSQISSFEYNGEIIILYDINGIDYSLDEIFFSKAEAEKKLKELNGKV